MRHHAVRPNVGSPLTREEAYSQLVRVTFPFLSLKPKDAFELLFMLFPIEYSVDLIDEMGKFLTDTM